MTVPDARARRERVLVIAHGHPDFATGGGELAAWRLSQAYREAPGVEACWLLARVDRGRGATGAISLRREHEYLWEQSLRDWHLLRAANPHATDTGFVELLQALQPSIVHVHHVAHLGVEMLRTLRRTLPQARLLMTLHEYMAICQSDGQMVTPQQHRLCERDSPDDCHRCHPQHSPEDFWLRKRFLQQHYERVDAFVAPSEFLRQRYIAWGIAPERIHVIENGQADEAPLDTPPGINDSTRRRRFGFFGQVNPYKGLDLLLDALTRLSPAERAGLVLEINCAQLEHQTPALQARIDRLVRPLIDDGCVVWRGPYRPEELRRRLAAVDWVVVPSIWWENSPLVIQEAFSAGRPVLCSDIGGMAEKVRHDVDGLHVPVADAHAWGHRLRDCAGPAGAATWARLRAGIRRPPTHAAVARAHLGLAASAGSEQPPARTPVVIPLHPVTRTGS